MSREGRKFEPISGLDLPEEDDEQVENRDIEQGLVILKLKGQEPLVFDIFTKNPDKKIFLIEFFMEFGKTLYESIKEKPNED
tara:strand:- start:5716 stop:5961 length:246 start_codon:yes stop_codon:yes gene_type:complete